MENPYESPRETNPLDVPALGGRSSLTSQVTSGLFGGLSIGATTGSAGSGIFGIVAGIVLVWQAADQAVGSVETVLAMTLATAIMGTISGAVVGLLLGIVLGVVSFRWLRRENALQTTGTIAGGFLGMVMGLIGGRSGGAICGAGIGTDPDCDRHRRRLWHRVGLAGRQDVGSRLSDAPHDRFASRPRRIVASDPNRCRRGSKMI
ncbi:MAG: hypothetical protein R3C28_22680 [Pirellulaceae bacterium]